MPEDINNQEEQRGPDTLDVYKTNPLFRLRQKIRWLTPKKKLLFLALPLLLAVMAAGLYLVLAGPGDPVMRLAIVADDAILNINNQTLQCGQTYTFYLLTDVSVSHANNNGIVTAGAFLKYDPKVFTNISIDGSSSAYKTAASERVDADKNLIEVIRGQASPGINADNQILAKITATVSTTYSGQTTIRFYGSQSSDPAELKSIFIENGGKNFEPDYSKAGYDAKIGAYNLNIKCDYCPGKVCGGNEVCAGGNWYGDAANRCCENGICTTSAELYLDPAEKWLNQGDNLTIFVKRRPATEPVAQAIIVLDGYNESVLSLQRQSGQSVNGGQIKFTVVPEKPDSDIIAAMNFNAVGEGEMTLNFIQNQSSVVINNGNALAVVTSGKYHVTKPTVRLCPGTDLIVTPSSNSVDFYWCAEPASKCEIGIPQLPQDQAVTKYYIDDGNIREHNVHFDGLNSDESYNYDIICRKDYYKNYELTDSSFKTLAENWLTISDVVVTGITSNKATISWMTNKPATSWVYLSDKSLPVGSDERVTQHSVVLRGLKEEKYTYYIMSAMSAVKKCASPSQSADCSASQKFEFTTKSQRDTYDANLILKVDRDRVCDEWLYCNASAQVLDSKQNPPKWQDVCFSVGKCNALDQGGRCVSMVDEEQSQLGALTYNHPGEADQIKNLSGYNKIGLDWGASKIIAGYYPYSSMKETGAPVGIANGSFEDGTTRPWKSHNNGILSNYRDGANRILRVKPNYDPLNPNSTGAYSGAKLEKLASSISKRGSYVISFQAKTDSPNIGGQRILVQIGPYGKNKDQYTVFRDPNNITTGYASLKNYWQEFVLKLEAKVLSKDIDGPLNITFVRAPQESDNSAFYLDNVNMKSVLAAADNYLAARSCRMYPTQNAPACDYYDQQANRDYRGWQGYCVETDPGYPARQFSNQPMCLNWWPVDVIQGESNIFSNETVVGYTGRKPLYYCLESSGGYPYYNKELYGYHQTDTTGAKGIFDLDASYLKVSRDEIVEIRIDQVELDKQDSTYNDCNVVAVHEGSAVKDTASLPAAGGAGEKTGALIFNQSNKQYWSSDFKGEFTREGKTAYVNPGAAVRCSGQGAVDDLLVLTGRLEFDAQDVLQKIYLQGYDYNDNNGNYKFYHIYLTFLGERCNVLAQVVTLDGENTPWAARVQEGGWPANDPTNTLGYDYKQDYRPYGAALPDEPVYDPSAWEKPLYVMPADTTTLQAPYQVRAGSPYAISGTFTQTGSCSNSMTQGRSCNPNGDGSDCNALGTCMKITTGPKAGQFSCVHNGNYIYDDAAELCPQKLERTSCVFQKGRCTSEITATAYGDIGDTQCIAGSAENLSKKGCKNNFDCGYNYESGDVGLCVGINLSEPQKKVISGGFAAGQDKLSKLFAKSYGVWVWEWDNGQPTEGGQRMRYVQKFGTAATTDYEWNITNTGNLPKVTDIWIDNKGDKDFTIVNQGQAILKFGSWIDPNQLPMVGYSVDWDDGTVVSESGLRINGRDMNNPHILVHYYKYDANCPNRKNGACVYQPKIQIEDNWGKKGYGTFAYEIIVKPK